jgi:hypothetical protein
MQKLEQSYFNDKVYVTAPGTVVGFIVREKGHFPNPTAEFEVFKIIAMDFSRKK